MNGQPLISYFKNLNTVAGHISILELIQSIKTGTINGWDFSNLVTQIRKEKNKDNANKIKKGLPKVTLSGVFDHHRVTDKFLTHSGLLQIDIDELPPGIKDFKQLRQKLEKDKYSFVCFSSPSDKLKLIVKIPAIKEKHPSAFLALEKYYQDNYGIRIDKATKDITRLCFLSHDPNIFFNENAPVYTELTVMAAAANPSAKPAYTTTNTKNDDVENCIQQIEHNGIDITGTYPDWVKIGFALVDGFGEAGRVYYHRVSVYYIGYDADTTNTQYSNCLKANGTNKIRLASFFQACKYYGIDTKSQKKIVETHSKNSEKNSEKQQKNVEKNSENIAGQAIDHLKSLEKQINPDCESWEEFVQQNEFYYQGSCYFTAKQSRTKTYYERISNFIMKFLYFFPDGTNNAKWYIKIQNDKGQTAEVELTSKDLNTISSFKSAIMSQGRFSFSGNQSQLDKIIEYHNNEYKEAHRINCLGWQPDHNIYAYSNGVIDCSCNFIPANNIGIVTTNEKNYYLPACSELTKNDLSFLNERKFIYKIGTLTFADYNRYIFEAYGVNGAIGNAYLIAAIFRDIIFNERASFPYLFLFGEAGAGKTTFTDFHLSVFGNPQSGIGISNDSTSKSIARRISQFKNALTYIKEYTNNDVDSATIGLLKTGYEGVGYDRAQTTNDNKTHQTGIYSGVFIDGNELPEKNSALFSRTITITFEKSVFTDVQSAAFNFLKDETGKGLGQIFIEIWQHRDVIQQRFAEVYRNACSYLKSNRCKDLLLNDRTIEHIALLIAPIRILEPYLKFHISTDEIINVLVLAATAQNEAMMGSNEIHTFFSTVAYLSNELKVREGIDYHIKVDAEGIEVLYLALSLVYPKYVEQCKKTNIQPIGKSSLQAILKNKPYTKKSTQKGAEYAGVDKTLKKRAWQFVYKDLNIEMYRLDSL